MAGPPATLACRRSAECSDACRGACVPASSAGSASSAWCLRHPLHFPDRGPAGPAFAPHLNSSTRVPAACSPVVAAGQQPSCPGDWFESSGSSPPPPPRSWPKVAQPPEGPLLRARLVPRVNNRKTGATAGALLRHAAGCINSAPVPPTSPSVSLTLQWRRRRVHSSAAAVPVAAFTHSSRQEFFKAPPNPSPRRSQFSSRCVHTPRVGAPRTGAPPSCGGVCGWRGRCAVALARPTLDSGVFGVTHRLRQEGRGRERSDSLEGATPLSNSTAAPTLMPVQRGTPFLSRNRAFPPPSPRLLPGAHHRWPGPSLRGVGPSDQPGRRRRAPVLSLRR